MVAQNGHSRNGEHSYDIHDLSAFDPGHWFMFSEDFLDIFKRDQCILFMCLLRHRGVVLNRYPKLRKTGWFFCTANRLEWLSRIDQQAQKRIIKQLVEMKVMECKCFGWPRKRHFRINRHALESLTRTARRQRAIQKEKRERATHERKKQREQRDIEQSWINEYDDE